MARPRRELVNPQETPFYHCFARCVRRAYLCGDDALTGRNFDHRKLWIVNRIQELTSTFAIDVCAYAVMSNHYHLVVHLDEAEALRWSDDEVLRRWGRCFKGPLQLQQYLKGEHLSEVDAAILSKYAKDYRKRLASLSWFMACLNEPIARAANREDECTGRFWEQRFGSQPLFDLAALLSCMAYVDLNPVRAGIADSLESSDFTSIQQRLNDFAQQHARPAAVSKQAVAEVIEKATEDKVEEVPQEVPQEVTETHAIPSCLSPHQPNATLQSLSECKPLFPFIGDENMNKPHDGLLFSEADYIELVQWTGRCIREDKRGFIPPDVVRLVDKLQLSPQLWLAYAQKPTRSCLNERAFAA